MKTNKTMTQEERIEAAPSLLSEGKDHSRGDKRIVVVDKGFVYVGEVEEAAGGIVIHEAENIRYWGTTKGLGELRSGPTEKTKYDHTGTVRVPMGSVIHMIDCTGDTKW